MSNRRDVGELSRIFYKRLKVTIGRSGLTMMQDVRDRDKWIRELSAWGETSVLEELDEDTVYQKMIDFMDECKWTDREKEIRFKEVTGKNLYKITSVV